MQPPERPFVPRRTPTKAQPAVGAVDFTLSRPFVAGAERETNTAFGAESGETSAISGEPLPPIERFLEFAPMRAAVSSEIADAAPSGDYPVEQEELPPVEHFLDPVPPTGELAANAQTEARVSYAAQVEYAEEMPSGGDQPTDWVETDWQQYDWRAAAALGDSGEHEASTAWAATDWDATMSRAKDNKPTAAQAIATALDEIAKKIRDGELALPGPGAITDPRTFATTLAALLGIRQ